MAATTAIITRSIRKTPPPKPAPKPMANAAKNTII